MRSSLRAFLRSAWMKPLLWLACAAPLLWWIGAGIHNALGANPAEYLIRSTGDQALRMLCITLCITPLRIQFGLPELARFRRMLGLWVYAYAVLHAVGYAVLDMGLDVDDITRDVLKRPFIALGVLCFLWLTPLAVTSWTATIRWLGAVRWRRLHQSVYAIALLALLHFYWMRASKNNVQEVWWYGAWIAGLLLWRIGRFFNTSGNVNTTTQPHRE